jgi:hypothetical protein
MANVRVYGGGGGGGGGGAKSRSTSSEGSPLLAGLLVGFVLIIAWVMLAHAAHDDVGLVAWGAGGLLGIVVAKVARPPTKATGTLAALLATGAILVAKPALVMFALQPALRQEFLTNQEATASLFLLDMTQNRSFSPELQHTLDTRPDLLRDTSFLGAGEEIKFRMVSEASDRAKAATPAEREWLVRTHLDNTLLEKVGFIVLLLTTFGPLDLLWMGLGISTAWKLGQGVL